MTRTRRLEVVSVGLIMDVYFYPDFGNHEAIVRRSFLRTFGGFASIYEGATASTAPRNPSLSPSASLTIIGAASLSAALIAGQMHPRDPGEVLDEALPKTPCNRATTENINSPSMVHSGHSLPDPFQDDNTDNADDAGQLSVAEEDQNSGQDVLNEFGSGIGGINKSDSIKLKEPWHTLAMYLTFLWSKHCSPIYGEPPGRARPGPSKAEFET
ncbi:hypothetical protein EMPS_10674 [Entomortierella parvispora]|uniref:Uncharacterized protein n=1 Tax=Entomortierella parvispora TaxID=205924 RepID=A0A9P3HKB5_9FUNG|nr:hypothetical protein EMPS_10674 [Entomortierella parvispora]